MHDRRPPAAPPGLVGGSGDDSPAALAARFQRAFALHQQGRLAAAEALYREIIALAPAHFDALHLAGVIAAQKRQFTAAVELIGRQSGSMPAAPQRIRISATP